MTTKVLITYEGDSPLLRKEVIDLYHIAYINEKINNNTEHKIKYTSNEILLLIIINL